MEAKKYPIGIQNFEKIRKEGFVYVDKTDLVYELARNGIYYFLSRPRRFGKSLLLSTFQAYFEGKKELFDGLAISRKETLWKQYPVLHLDLNAEKYDNTEALNTILDRSLRRWEATFSCPMAEKTVAGRFESVIRQAYEKTGLGVVVLIDEYDKPLLQAFDNPALQDDYRATLKAFYGVLKSSDKYIRFAFLTGVTKFGKVSVFSDLNNLTDISFDRRYSTICGITEAELHRDFDESVACLAEANGLSKSACYEKLKWDYDGYHFEVDTPGMYNPFSVLNTLSSCQFRDYWFETGTPTFLVNQLKKTDYPLDMMTEEELTADTLNSIDIMDENPLPLLYQSGYLTIVGYDEEFASYKLGFPNREVREGFIKYLLPFYTPKNREAPMMFIRSFVTDIRKGNADGFLRRLEQLFARGDYQVMGDLELYFQNCMYVIFTMLGFYVEVERRTTDGRMDIVMQTPDYIYLMELKVDKSAEEALAQIEEKQYAAAFAGDSRKLFKIGINFSTSTRRIDGWKLA